MMGKGIWAIQLETDHGGIEADFITVEDEILQRRMNIWMQVDKEFMVTEKVSMFDTKYKTANSELSDVKIVVDFHIALEA